MSSPPKKYNHMSKLNIKTFDNEIIDRLAEIFTYMVKMLLQKGIKGK